MQKRDIQCTFGSLESSVSRYCLLPSALCLERLSPRAIQYNGVKRFNGMPCRVWYKMAVSRMAHSTIKNEWNLNLEVLNVRQFDGILDFQTHYTQKRSRAIPRVRFSATRGVIRSRSWNCFPDYTFSSVEIYPDASTATGIYGSHLRCSQFTRSVFHPASTSASGRAVSIWYFLIALSRGEARPSDEGTKPWRKVGRYVIPTTD